MQRQLGTIQLYEPGPWPSKLPVLHIGLLSDVLCRVPLMPCFVNGNPTATTPHSLRRKQASQFEFERADTQPGKGDGSKLYEVNDWLWNFGRGLPRKISVAEAERMRQLGGTMQKSNAWKTRKRNAESRDAE